MTHFFKVCQAAIWIWNVSNSSSPTSRRRWFLNHSLTDFSGPVIDANHSELKFAHSCNEGTRPTTRELDQFYPRITERRIYPMVNILVVTKMRHLSEKHVANIPSPTRKWKIASRTVGRAHINNSGVIWANPASYRAAPMRCCVPSTHIDQAGSGT